MDENDVDWEERYRKMREDYQILEARVVALAGREYEIKDSTITKHFRCIRDHIDLWIDDLQSEDKAIFKAEYQAFFHKAHRKDVLDVLGRAGFEAESIRRGWEIRLGRIATCIYVILSKIISTYLQSIFERPYPLGITKEQYDLFESSQIKSARESKDPALYYRWVGETLSYISHTLVFDRLRDEEIDRYLKPLKADLSQWLGSKAMAKYEDTLKETILKPAVETHRLIRCSGKKFVLRYINDVQNPISQDALMCDILDVESWRVAGKSDTRGTFGCLMPSLTMEIAIGQRDIMFVPAVLLGYKTEFLDTRKFDINISTGQEVSGNEASDGQYSETPPSSAENIRASTPKAQKSDLKRSGVWSGIQNLVSGGGGHADGRRKSTSGGPSKQNAKPSASHPQSSSFQARRSRATSRSKRPSPTPPYGSADDYDSSKYPAVDPSCSHEYDYILSAEPQVDDDTDRRR